MSLFNKLLHSIDRMISRQETSRREAYLAQGQNVPEIESRMRALESSDYWRPIL